MTFPWVFETIARARQDETRSAVARHRFAQDHCEWRIYRVPRRGVATAAPVPARRSSSSPSARALCAHSRQGSMDRPLTGCCSFGSVELRFLGR